MTKSKAPVRKARIMTLDIETAPGKGYVWSLFDTYMPLDRLIEPGRALTAAWQWYGEREVHFAAEWQGKTRADWLRKLHAAMSEADAIVTFNGDKFDLPKLRGEFVLHGLPPLAPVTSIDLYKTVKKLGYISGKLQFIGPLLKIGAKVKHAGFELWVKVMSGDKVAQAKMEKYNKQDTRLTSRLYTKLRPFIINHPRLHEGHVCPACGSGHTQLRGVRRTKVFRIERAQCQSCGTWFDAGRKKV